MTIKPASQPERPWIIPTSVSLFFFSPCLYSSYLMLDLNWVDCVIVFWFNVQIFKFSDPIVKDQGRGATPGGMATSSTPVSSSSMMAGK